MRRIVMAAAAILCFGVCSYAQVQINNNNVNQNGGTPAGDQTSSESGDGSSFYVGARFLPTFTDVKVHQPSGGVYKTHFIVGYGWGGFVGMDFTNHVGMQLEVMDAVLSEKYTDNLNIERRIDLNYINIPLLLVINTNSNMPVNLNFVAGPQLGIKTGDKISPSVPSGETDTVQAVLAVKPMDVGVAYGAGLDFGNMVKFSIGFRNVYGLVDISDKSNNIETNQYYILDKSHVRTYSGYVGITLRF